MNGEEHPQLKEKDLPKPIATTVLHCERLNAFPLRSGTRQGCFFSHFYLT